MLAAKLLEPDPFLSIPKNPFNRTTSVSAAGVSGLFKVPAKTGAKTVDAAGLRGNSTSISRKRAPTPTDSDTESPRKPKKIPPMRGNIGLAKSVAGPSRLGLNGKSIAATTHTLPTGPGWEVTPRGPTDGLDELISGVVNGTVEAPEGDDDFDHIDAEAEPNELAGKVDDTRNPDPRGDHFKCGKDNDGNPSTGPNEWLAKKFDEMHDMYHGVPGKNPFAIRQYMQAASVMRRTLYPITSGKDALKIKGVGQSIADRVCRCAR
jgi:DNA polymerase lambda